MGKKPDQHSPLEQGISERNSFFDHDTVEHYRLRREAKDSFNELMDGPTTLKFIGDVAGLEVLDVGCGLGSMARLLASRGASSILGVDISPAMVDRARKSTSSASVQYQVGQVQDLSEQASFDVIVSNLVAHFIEDYSGFLTEISRRLKPRGRAVI